MSSSIFEPHVSTTNLRPSWIELPPAIYVPEIALDRPLVRLMDTYQRLQKDSLAELRYRQEALGAIISLANKRDSATNLDVLKGISNTARRKKDYLRILESLYEKEILLTGDDIYNDMIVRPYFEDYNATSDRKLSLQRDTHYDSKLGHVWGDFWLEAVDPCHRQLDHQKMIWVNQKDKKPFFLWLDAQQISPHQPKMIYFNNQERTDCILSIESGLLTKNGAPLTTRSHEERLFIVNQNDEIMSCLSSDSNRHISMTVGKPIVAAGVIEAEHGKVTALESNSGHYLPDRGMAFQMINVLRGKGIEIRQEIPFLFFENFQPIKSSLGDFERHFASGNLGKSLSLRPSRSLLPGPT